MKTHLAVAAALAGLCAQAAFAVNEGGDTWSRVEPRASTRYAPVMTVATTAKLSDLQRNDSTAYGTPVASDPSGRVIELGAGSRWVDVAYGERVTFTAPDQNGNRRSFAWQFDVSPVRTHVDLAEVAPSDFPASGVRVFVAPQPDYRGN